MANKSNNDNLEILAQIVQAEAARRNELDTKLDTWARKKNPEVSALRGDTTLTKEEITQLRNELQWERTNRRKEKEAQTKAIADLEIKDNTALANSSTLEKARQEVATNLRAAREESMSTTAEITERLAQVPTRKRRPTVAALFSQEEEFLQAQRERLEFLKGTQSQARCRHHHHRSNLRAQKEATQETTLETTTTISHPKGATEGDQTGADPGNLPDPGPGTQGHWKKKNSLRHWH